MREKLFNSSKIHIIIEVLIKITFAIFSAETSSKNKTTQDWNGSGCVSCSSEEPFGVPGSRSS